MENLSVPGGASLGSYLYGVVFHFECMVWGNGTYGQYILGKPANGLGNRAIYQPAAP